MIEILVLLIFGLMFIPPIAMLIIGGLVFKRNKKGAKILWIIAAIYLIIGLGICGAVFITS